MIISEILTSNAAAIIPRAPDIYCCEGHELDSNKPGSISATRIPSFLSSLGCQRLRQGHEGAPNTS